MTFEAYQDELLPRFYGHHPSNDVASASWGTRKWYFMRGLEALRSYNVGALEDLLRKHFADTELRIARGSLKDAVHGKPVTLSAAHCICCNLTHDWEDNSLSARQIADTLSTRKFSADSLATGVVVPSVFYANPVMIAKAREICRMNGREASKKVFESSFKADVHSRLFSHLEERDRDDHDGKKSGVRITSFLAEAVFNALKEGFATQLGDQDIEWTEVFLSDPSLGKQAGIQCKALLQNNGNAVSYVSKAQDTRLKSDPEQIAGVAASTPGE